MTTTVPLEDYICTRGPFVLNDQDLSALAYLNKGREIFNDRQRAIMESSFSRDYNGVPSEDLRGVMNVHVQECADCSPRYELEGAAAYVCSTTGITRMDLSDLALFIYRGPRGRETDEKLPRGLTLYGETLKENLRYLGEHLEQCPPCEQQAQEEMKTIRTSEQFLADLRLVQQELAVVGTVRGTSR